MLFNALFASFLACFLPSFLLRAVSYLLFCLVRPRFGHRPTVFEAAEDVGGIWSKKPTNQVVYQGLVSNIPTAPWISSHSELVRSLKTHPKVVSRCCDRGLHAIL